MFNTLCQLIDIHNSLAYVSNLENRSQDPASPSPPPRLLETVRDAIRLRHYSLRTEQSYVQWIRRFIYFHGKRHPRDMGAEEVTAFLNDLVRSRDVAAATQNQALSALLFLYREVLGVKLPWLDGMQRAKRPVRVPTVLSVAEVTALLKAMTGTKWLMAALLYGAGLRLRECLTLRVKDVDFDYRQIVVRHGKGAKDRRTLLPGMVMEPLRAHLAHAKALHERDLAAGFGEAELPNALEIKYPNAGRQWGWQYGVPVAQVLHGSAQRRDPPPPCLRKLRDPRREGGDAFGTNPQARELPHAAPLFRHAPAGERLRHPDGTGASRARERGDDDDLHARDEQGRARGEEPAGSCGAGAGDLCRVGFLAEGFFKNGMSIGT